MVMQNISSVMEVPMDIDIKECLEWKQICDEEGLDIDESQEPIHAKCIKHIKTVLDKYKQLKTSVDEQIDHLHKLKCSLEKDQICLGNLEEGHENYKQVKKAVMNLEMAEFSMKKELYGSVSYEIAQSVCRSYHPKIKCMKHEGKYIYKCFYCKYVHPTQGAIETHMCNEHDAPEFICYMCSFTSMNSRVVHLHLQNVHKFKTDV